MAGNEERIGQDPFRLQSQQQELALFDLGNQAGHPEPGDQAVGAPPVQAEEVGHERRGKVEEFLPAQPLGDGNRAQMFGHLR